MVEDMSVVVNVISNEGDEPTSCHGGDEDMYFLCFCFRGELGFLDCDDICMCVVNKHFGLLEFVFNSVDLKYNEISLTFTAGSLCLCCVCSFVVGFGLSVRLSWYSMWMRWLM